MSLRDLGTDRLFWPDLAAILRWLPNDSPLQRALHPEWAGWTVTNDQTAMVIDALRGANWQRSNGKGPRPDPSWRPSDVAEQRAKDERLRARAARHQQKLRGG